MAENNKTSLETCKEMYPNGNDAEAAYSLFNKFASRELGERFLMRCNCDFKLATTLAPVVHYNFAIFNDLLPSFQNNPAQMLHFLQTIQDAYPQSSSTTHCFHAIKLLAKFENDGVAAHDCLTVFKDDVKQTETFLEKFGDDVVKANKFLYNFNDDVEQASSFMMKFPAVSDMEAFVEQFNGDVIRARDFLSTFNNDVSLATNFLNSFAEATYKANEIAIALSALGVVEQQACEFIADNKITSLKVLFDSRTHEQTVKKYHECVDGKAPTVTFVIKKDKVSGGLYVPNQKVFSWTHDAQSTLFTLCPQYKKYAQCDYEDKKVSQIREKRGPLFGDDELAVEFSPLRCGVRTGGPVFTLPHKETLCLDEDDFKEQYSTSEHKVYYGEVDRCVVFSFTTAL